MSIRMERVAGVLHECLSNIFRRSMSSNEVGFLTITNIKVSPDFGVAKIYLSILDGEPNATLAFLDKNKKELRKKLASQMRNQFKRIPELEFYLDTQIENARHIEVLLEKVKAKDNIYDQKA